MNGEIPVRHFLVFAVSITVSCAHRGERYDGPAIDVHAHVALTEYERVSPTQPLGLSAITALDDAAKISHSALLVVAKEGEVENTQAMNDRAIDASAASGGRFFPVCSVHPKDAGAALRELERLKSRGVRMVKLHPNAQDFDVASPEIAAIADKAEALGLVLLFDSFSPVDAEELGKFFRLAMRHPKLQVVLAHMGGSQFHQLSVFGLLREFDYYAKNVWFDLSYVALFYADSPYREQLLWNVRKVGTDRVLFGTDWPVDNPLAARQAVEKLGLTEAEQRQVFYSNAASLLQLEVDQKISKEGVR